MLYLFRRQSGPSIDSEECVHGEKWDVLDPLFLVVIVHGQPDGLLGMVFVVVCTKALGMDVALCFHFNGDNTAALLDHEVDLVSATLRGVVIRLTG